VVGLAWYLAQLSPCWAHDADPPTVVEVLPALRLHAPVAPSTYEPLGRELSAALVEQRERRARELDRLAMQLEWAVPAEINAALGAHWDGQFERARFPLGARRRLERGLASPDDVERRLRAVGTHSRHDAVLVIWVDALRAKVLTQEALPGEVVDTPVGPVVVDATDEPYRVEAVVGVALIRADGTIDVYLHQTFDTVLLGEEGLEPAALEVAARAAAAARPSWRVGLPLSASVEGP
jgi:hypothetical protein